MNKQALIDMGGKLWEKGEICRIYVKSEVIKKLIDFDAECKKNCYLAKNTKAIFQRIDSEGAWLNCNTGKFESKKVTVQTWFEQCQYADKFGY